MKKLWQKTATHRTNQLVEAFTSGEDVVLDNRLIEADVWGSIAHAAGLVKIGILTRQEGKTLCASLQKILKDYANGNFTVALGDEDVHTKVEGYLIDHVGEVGKKIHTGRSRNDQALVDVRLVGKKEMEIAAVKACALVSVFLSQAKKYEWIPMPGYTHMQQAMPSSVGLWLGSFAESLLDDLLILERAYEINDQSPLGSGASYGVSLPLDREYTAGLLGFAKVQNNTLYAQAARGKTELLIVQALSHMMLTLSRFAQDMLLFTTGEFHFFTIDPTLTTGSSIMPQKQNFDLLELIRAKTATVLSYEQRIATTIVGLPSGYNRDLQETKEPFLEAFDIVRSSVEIVALVVGSLEPTKALPKAATAKELYATHAAYALVKKGMPFRDAYREIGTHLDTLSAYDPIQVLKETRHVGAPGNLRLLLVKRALRGTKQRWITKQKHFQNRINHLVQGVL